MRRLVLGLSGLAICAAAAGATAAQAAPPQWYYTPTEIVPYATPAKIEGGGTLRVAPNMKGRGVRCVPRLVETIENPSVLVAGIDSLTSFYGKCVPGTSTEHIEPCLAGESWSLGAVGTPWPSELVRVGPSVRDAFSGAALEVLCQATGQHRTYTEVGPFEPRVTVNKLTFVPWARFVSSPYEIVLKGTLKLEPEPPHTTIEAK